MNDSIETQVREIAANVFNLHAKQVTFDTSPSSVSGWDSLQHLNFILALESTFDINLDPEDIEQIRSVGGAIEVVRRKKS